MLSIMPAFRFIGEVNGAPCDGDIVIDKITNEMKCWVKDCGWVDLGESSERKEKPVKMKPMICERCGGSFKGKKCFWCDTEYAYTYA